MKKTTINTLAPLMASLLFSSSVWAYTDDKQEEYCKKPKFTDTSFTAYSEASKAEVVPGSEVSFRASADTDIKTLKITLKGQRIEPDVNSTSTYHQVAFKLPADLTGFVRINVTAKALLKCAETTGWLIKIADGGHAVDASTPSSAPQPEQAKDTSLAGHHEEAHKTDTPVVANAESQAKTTPAVGQATAQRTTLLEQKTELSSNMVNAKVIKVLFPVGFKTPLHTHDGPGPRYIMKGKLKVEDKASKTYSAGEVFWETGEEMTIENVGDDVAEVIIFEMAPAK